MNLILTHHVTCWHCTLGTVLFPESPLCIFLGSNDLMCICCQTRSVSLFSVVLLSTADNEIPMLCLAVTGIWIVFKPWMSRGWDFVGQKQSGGAQGLSEGECLELMVGQSQSGVEEKEGRKQGRASWGPAWGCPWVAVRITWLELSGHLCKLDLLREGFAEDGGMDQEMGTLWPGLVPWICEGLPSFLWKSGQKKAGTVWNRAPWYLLPFETLWKHG